MDDVAQTGERRLGGSGRTRAASRAGRPVVVAAPAPSHVRTPLGAALPAALWSAAVTVAAITVLVVIGWAAGPDVGATPGVAVATGAQAWLLSQGADLFVDGVRLSVTPLGLLLIPVFVLARSGRWAARAADVRSWTDAARTTGLLTFFYAAAGLGVALLAETPNVQPDPVSAVAATATVALLAGGWGVVRGAGLWTDAAARLPRQGMPMVRGAFAGLAVMVAGGGLVVAAALIAHAGQVGSLWADLAPDPVGGVLLILLSVALIPNAILWGAAFAAGPGFAVGVGTTVAPSGVALGGVPAFPLLGALPGTGSAPLPSLVSLLLPVLAAALVGVVVARDRRMTVDSPERAALIAGAAGALGGVALGAWCALAAGSLAGGRMTDLGPSGLEVALVAALEMGVVAAAVCWEWRRHTGRTITVD